MNQEEAVLAASQARYQRRQRCIAQLAAFAAACVTLHQAAQGARLEELDAFVDDDDDPPLQLVRLEAWAGDRWIFASFLLLEGELFDCGVVREAMEPE
jgi:hypothetical protein